ncbi:MAG: amidohydrolase family protein [bacterium]|nr:amidohydrolase family protein [bacterium]
MIDAHLHIGHRGRGLEDTLKHIEAIGAEKAVCLPIETADKEYEWLTETVAAAYEQYPDKIIPFCHVDVTRKDAVQELERRAKLGIFKGYGEQKQHIPLNHPGLERVLAFCNEIGWPVTWHFQEGEKGYNQGIGHLETLLKKFQKIKFIGHAQSWWANIGADVPPPEETLYPKGPVVAGGLADRLLSDYEHMYADLSAGSGLGGLTRDEEFGKVFLARHRKKLLFATDCPCMDGQGGGLERGCFASQSLPFLKEAVNDPEALEDILHRNAVRVIGLES